MITPVLNSGRAELSFFDKDDKLIELKNVVCSEYKLYTDNNDLYLYVKLTSPLALIDPKFFIDTFKIKLAFLNEEEKVIAGYKFNPTKITWETEGIQGLNKVPTWQVIFALNDQHEIVTA